MESKSEMSSMAKDSGICLDSGISLESTVSNYGSDKSAKQLSDQITQTIKCNPSQLYPFLCDEDGDTLLHLAISRELTEVCCSVIQSAPHPDCLDVYNNMHQTPLHLAVITGQCDLVRLLMVSGATIDSRDRKGNSAVHLACANGDLDAVEAIFKPVSPSELRALQPLYYRTKPHSDNAVSLIDLPNYEGQSCLLLAAKSGNLKLVEMLYKLGGNINAQEGKCGQSVLHWAVAHSKLELVHLLLTMGKKIRVNIKSYSGKTPLDTVWNMFKSQPNNGLVRMIIVMLIENGAEPRLWPSLGSESSSDAESTDEDIDIDEGF
ncbi:NF-kappa-B inhibitor cactus [Halotydeus destructor]|nr:NF-kappa-B inhibitor cactus [Halotydeus destructor]